MTSRATSTSRACDEALPARDGVDFDRVEPAVFAGQQIDAGQRRMDGGGGAAGHFDERVVGRKGLGGRPAADVGAPVELVDAAHGENAVADDEQANVVAFVGDELLQVEHRAELREHFERAEGQIFVGQPRDAAALAAKERLEHDIAAELLKSEHGFVSRLATDRARREQAGGLQLGRRQKFIDGRFDGPGGIDDDSASRFVPRQAIHAKDDLLERAGGHGADEDGVEVGEGVAGSVRRRTRDRRSRSEETTAEIVLKGSTTISWSAAAARVRSRAYQESGEARTAKRMR